ncbi:MAG: hypothetical protein IJT14_00815 [Rickettsiales bacterium]|nr:hypothetical protein [Rickettsiales bacterium]
MQANNPNDNDIFVHADNSSIYDGLPVSFYDPGVFNFLGTNNGKKNVHTNGKTCNFHSVTLLPVNKQTATVPMPSFCGEQKEPFTKHTDNRIIGFALDVKDDNKVDIIEKTQIDGLTADSNIGMNNTDSIEQRFNGNITVRKKKPGQTNVEFIAEDLRSYSDKTNALKEFSQSGFPGDKVARIRSRSPLKAEDNTRGNNETIDLYNNQPNTTKGLPALRASILKNTGEVEFPYNEYVMKGINQNGAINTTALILDERKISPMNPDEQQSIADDINNYIAQTQQKAYKIERQTNRLTQLRNLDDVKQTLATIATSY